MKIRIKSKGLPKAQMWNSIIGQPSIDQNGLIWGANPGVVTKQDTDLLNNQGAPQPPNYSNIPAVNYNRVIYNTLMGNTPSILNTPGQQLNLTGSGSQNYAWTNFNTSPPPVNPNANKGYKLQPLDPNLKNDPSQNPIFGAAKNLQNTFDTGSAKDIKKGIAGFNDTYGTKLKNPNLITFGAKGRETAQKIGDVSKGVQMGIGFASAVTDYVEGLNNERDTKTRNRFAGLTDNVFSPVTQEDRGDYVETGTSYGMFRPDQMVVNKGMYTAKQGGENPNSMKIRIVSGPSVMAYGGQSNYGLDLGRKDVYTDMPESKSDSVSNTITGVPREMANIEAEGGETVYGDLDSDGILEHMKIGGPRHSEGGVPLNVPEGSFIFSDTAKMRIKDPEVLRYFGLAAKKGGYTPAEIAKRYDINKYKAILEDPNQDELSKNTAQLMINNYNKKLSQLALVQEQIKGFPQGVPNVSKEQIVRYGGHIGLPKYQDKGQVKTTTDNIVDPTTSPKQLADVNDPEYQKFMDLINRLNTKSLPGYQLINKLSVDDAKEFARLATKFGFNRKDDKGNYLYRVMQGRTPDYTYSVGDNKRAGFFGGYTPDLYERRVVEDVVGPDAIKNMSELDIRKAYFKELGVDLTGISDDKLKNPKTLYTDRRFFKEKFYPQFIKRFGKDDYRTLMGDDLMIGAEHYDSYRKKVPPPPPPGPKVYPGFFCEGTDANGIPNIKTQEFKSEEERKAAGMYASRQEALVNCPGTPPGKIPPGKKGEVPPKYWTPDDWALVGSALYPPKKYNPYIAPVNLEVPEPTFYDPNRELAANAEQLNILTQGLTNFGAPQSFMANASSAQGKGLENAANILSRYNNLNVGVANQFAPMQSQIRNQQRMMDAERATELYKGNVIAAQQFDNARRKYTRGIINAAQNRFGNRMYMDMINKVNPIYNLDPRSGLSFFKEGFSWDKLGGGGSGAGGSDWDSISKAYVEAKKKPGLADMTLNDFLRVSLPRTTATDSNNDGIPDNTRFSGVNPSLLNNMAVQAVQAFPQILSNILGRGNSRSTDEDY